MADRWPPQNDAGDSAEDGPDPGLLRGSSPRVVLARICDGDPLELHARCSAHVGEQALLIDPARLYSRSAARIAYSAMAWRGDPRPAEFIAQRIALSLTELVEEDQEAIAHGAPPSPDPDAVHDFVSSVLGLERALAPRACAAFNGLALPLRRAWFAVVVEGETIVDHAATAAVEEAMVRQRLRSVLEAISRATGHAVRDPEGGEA
jgi:hypothetical protein